MPKEETVSWPEACKKVVFGDGLYSDCRKKVPGFDGFNNSRFDSFGGGDDDDDEDEGPGSRGFTRALMKNAIEAPTPEDLAVADMKPKKRKKKKADDADADEDPGFIETLKNQPWLVYGGVALAVYLYFFWKKQEVVGTETPKIAAPTTVPNSL